VKIDHIHKLLDQATDEFHKSRDGQNRDRADQFDGQMATLKMIVDHTSDEIMRAEHDEKERAKAE
jgi:hypothetical protein